MNEILTEADRLEDPEAVAGAVVADGRSVIGAVLVPQHVTGMDAAAVLPSDFIEGGDSKGRGMRERDHPSAIGRCDKCEVRSPPVPDVEGRQAVLCE
ncbi:hypothetical protein ABIA39_005571 [Nocardia sp. GAS34]|uniref:hypothetical protein n=1 Tax=unclassified Nocardia TaxID=2637762 RepID=UPI003D1F1498